MEDQKHFPILSRSAKTFLAILATLASSERMRSFSGKKIFSANAASLKPNISLATMFIADNTEVLRKHYEEILNTVNDPMLL